VRHYARSWLQAGYLTTTEELVNILSECILADNWIIDASPIAEAAIAGKVLKK
jgi:hypothetical protein